MLERLDYIVPIAMALAIAALGARMALEWL